MLYSLITSKCYSPFPVNLHTTRNSDYKYIFAHVMTLTHMSNVQMSIFPTRLQVKTVWGGVRDECVDSREKCGSHAGKSKEMSKIRVDFSGMSPSLPLQWDWCPEERLCLSVFVCVFVCLYRYGGLSLLYVFIISSCIKIWYHMEEMWFEMSYMLLIIYVKYALKHIKHAVGY